jgi:hypothetical protein
VGIAINGCAPDESYPAAGLAWPSNTTLSGLLVTVKTARRELMAKGIEPR